MTFHIGQMVVCIADEFPMREFVSMAPSTNGIYTIRSMISGADKDMPGTYLRFDEFQGMSSCGNEAWWSAQAFRPMRPVNAEILMSLLRLAHNPNGANGCDGVPFQ